MVGLDAEWVAGRPVALLQLAVPGQCVLLRMHRLEASTTRSGDAAMASRLPASLHALLADRDVIKTGVGIGHDLKLLRGQFGLAASGVLDLQALASRAGFMHAGLQRLTAEVKTIAEARDTEVSSFVH